MDIFISYRSSRDSSDRDLRQVLDRAFADGSAQYELPFPNRTRRLWNFPNTMLDLEISRASARAATLVIALIGAREAAMFRSSGFARLFNMINPIPAPAGHGRGRRASWSSFDFRAARNSYCNFLSIGIGNATRASVAIKRLVLLGDPHFMVRPDKNGDRHCLPPSNIPHRLFLDELGRDQARGQPPFVSSRIAGLALVTGDRRSALLRFGEEAADCGRGPIMPTREDVTWLIPDDALVEPLSLAAFSQTSPSTFRVSVEEVRASIVIDSFNSLPASHLLVSREGMADKRRVSARIRLNRLCSKLFFTSGKKLLGLSRFSKYQSRRRAKRVLRARTDLSEVDLLTPRIGFEVGTNNSQSKIDLQNTFYIPHLNLIDEYPKTLSLLPLPDDGIVWPDTSAGADLDEYDETDLSEWHPSGPEASFCGMFISYRRELGGDEPDKVFREVLEVRAGPDGGLSFVMSVADWAAEGSQSRPLCEGEAIETEGALLLIENSRKSSRLKRTLCLFVDPTEECEASLSCRIGAVTTPVGPRRRRQQTDCILLVRVHGTPPDRDAFFAQATSAGPFEELVGRDFGNDEADLRYVSALFDRQLVTVSAAEHLLAAHQGRRRRLAYSDVDVHPFECGLNDIVERALTSPTITAPFKAGWSDRSAAPAPPGGAKGVAGGSR